ncbi:hypothetical protein CKAH01_05324 [Colletotrichum kahawae]|uniref:Uncharacterized protein n=1 Tax=Colletotrichum kahawae TaxID=34407 RepID=A0AAD9YD81_COLKA|nr:hypothetical protein CKAH01_05324 [Colletotrichum kahawae]
MSTTKYQGLLTTVTANYRCLPYPAGDQPIVVIAHVEPTLSPQDDDQQCSSTLLNVQCTPSSSRSSRTLARAVPCSSTLPLRRKINSLQKYSASTQYSPSSAFPFELHPPSVLARTCNYYQHREADHRGRAKRHRQGTRHAAWRRNQETWQNGCHDPLSASHSGKHDEHWRRRMATSGLPATFVRPPLASLALATVQPNTTAQSLVPGPETFLLVVFQASHHAVRHTNKVDGMGALSVELDLNCDKPAAADD